MFRRIIIFYSKSDMIIYVFSCKWLYENIISSYLYEGRHPRPIITYFTSPLPPVIETLHRAAAARVTRHLVWDRSPIQTLHLSQQRKLGSVFFSGSGSKQMTHSSVFFIDGV